MSQLKGSRRWDGAGVAGKTVLKNVNNGWLTRPNSFRLTLITLTHSEKGSSYMAYDALNQQ